MGLGVGLGLGLGIGLGLGSGLGLRLGLVPAVGLVDSAYGGRERSRQ